MPEVLRVSISFFSFGLAQQVYIAVLKRTVVVDND